MTSSSIPPYLLADGQKRALAAAARINAAASPPPPFATSHPANPTTHPTNPTSAAAPPPTAKPAKAAKPTKPKGNGNHSAVANPHQAVSGDLEAAWGAMADRIVAESRDQAAAQLVRPYLPAVLSALVDGASKAGSVGAADRAMLFRLLGHSSSTAKEQAKAGRTVHLHLGGRLSEAMARRASAVGRVIAGESVEIGHAGVAVPLPIGRKA
jgi:hypothetical protein